MLDADQLGDVVDVVGHVADGRLGKRALLVPLFDVAAPLLALEVVGRDVVEDFLPEFLELGVGGRS